MLRIVSAISFSSSCAGTTTATRLPSSTARGYACAADDPGAPAPTGARRRCRAGARSGAATSTVLRRLRAVVLVATANVSCLPLMTAWTTASCCLAVVSWSTIWARWIERDQPVGRREPARRRGRCAASELRVACRPGALRLALSWSTYVGRPGDDDLREFVGRDLGLARRAPGDGDQRRAAIWPEPRQRAGDRARGDVCRGACATGMPALRAASRRASSLWMIWRDVEGFVASL